MATPAPPRLPADVAEQLAGAYNTALLNLAKGTAQAVAAAWALVKPDDIDGGFARVLPQIVALTMRGQTLAAVTAQQYHGAVLQAHGLTPEGPTVAPQGFVGLSAEGTPLTEVMQVAPIRVKQQIAQGVEPVEALDAGEHVLTMIAESEPQEAAREVADVVLNTEPNYRGYLRQPNPGACARCLILANKFYRHNEGFLRHPRCHCSHVPIPVGSELLNVPTAEERFAELTPAQQNRIFTNDGAEAIRNGADVGQVVNARSGMRTPGDGFTSQGRTSRSLSGARLKAAGVKRRLSPLGCRRVAKDHDEYLHLLHLNGYLI